MKQLHTFDEVFDSQKVFRKALEALSNPGRTLSIAEQSEKLYGEQPGLLALAMTLLDASVSFCAPDDAELTEQILLHTHAAPVDAQEADFLFCTRAENLTACIEAAKCGTLADPHTGATILVRVPQEESVRVRLSGPGVDGALETEVPRDVLAAIRTRNAQAYEYPQGVDFFFLLPGDTILAIPRLVRMEDV